MNPGPRRLLFAGMAAGLLLALSGVVQAPRGELPDGVLARVGDQQLLLADYQRTLNGLQAERRKPLDERLRRRVLERMVDEYLLLEHARRIDLGFEIPELRKRTVDQVLQILRAQADALEPEEGELLAFLEANRAYFGVQGAVQPATLAPIRAQVLNEWRRRAAERLLESLLEDLRREIPVQVREDVV